MTYDDPQGKGKPVEETVEEHTQAEVVETLINGANLHRLSAALKILNEMTREDAGDGRGEALGAELMRKLDEEAAREAP